MKLLGGLLVCLLLAACGGEDVDADPVEETATITGTITLAVDDEDGLAFVDYTDTIDEDAAGAPAISIVECRGARGYSDIREGATVTVRDQSGTVIALGDVLGGRLTEGAVGFDRTDDGYTSASLEFIESNRYYLNMQTGLHVTLNDQGRAACEFDILVNGVPTTDATFYSVEVASRGEVRFSAEDMERQDWTVQLTLGD